MAATAAGASAVAQPQGASTFLTGSDAQSLNLPQVLQHATALEQELKEVLAALANRAAVLRWQDFVQKFSEINRKLMILHEHLRPYMKNTSLHPKQLSIAGQPPLDPDTMAIMLSSSLTPDMIEKSESIMQGMQSWLQGQNENQAYETLHTAVEDFNEFISELTGDGAPLDLRAKAPTKRAIDANSHELRQRVQQHDAKRAQPLPAPAAGPQPRSAAAAAKRKREAMDPLLAAVLTGEGLRPGDVAQTLPKR